MSRRDVKSPNWPLVFVGMESHARPCSHPLTKTFAVTVIGRDEPGIIAALSGTLYRLGCNLADTCMSLLNGEFAMILIVQGPWPSNASELARALMADASKYELKIAVDELSRNGGVFEEPPAARRGGDQERALVTVYGTDQPGIVHSVAAAIASKRSNINDLRTERRSAAPKGDGKSEPLYVLFVEVQLASGVSKTMLRHALDQIRARLNVQITVQDVAAMEL